MHSVCILPFMWHTKSHAQAKLSNGYFTRNNSIYKLLSFKTVESLGVHKLFSINSTHGSFVSYPTSKGYSVSARAPLSEPGYTDDYSHFVILIIIIMNVEVATYTRVISQPFQYSHCPEQKCSTLWQ